MANHIIILALVMLVAGVFGGLINFYQINQNINDRGSLPRCIVIGVGASFLVPVILDLVNSKLIFEVQGDPSRLLIFAGLCLIAALAARVLIINMSDRIFREANLARVQSDATQQELRMLKAEWLPLIEAQTEHELPEGVTEDVDTELDDYQSRVLKSLAFGPYTFRSNLGICRETGLDDATVGKSLMTLVGRDLASKIHGAQGVRWYLTDKGRRSLAALNI